LHAFTQSILTYWARDDIVIDFEFADGRKLHEQSILRNIVLGCVRGAAESNLMGGLIVARSASRQRLAIFLGQSKLK
jgi:hypothetical protein